jgi:hypothetical protein
LELWQEFTCVPGKKPSGLDADGPNGIGEKRAGELDALLFRKGLQSSDGGGSYGASLSVRLA